MIGNLDEENKKNENSPMCGKLIPLNDVNGFSNVFIWDHSKYYEIKIGGCVG